MKGGGNSKRERQKQTPNEQRVMETGRKEMEEI